MEKNRLDLGEKGTKCQQCGLAARGPLAKLSPTSSHHTTPHHTAFILVATAIMPRRLVIPAGTTRIKDALTIRFSFKRTA